MHVVSGFCVYGWFDEFGCPRYIGKGSGNRPWCHINRPNPNNSGLKSLVRRMKKSCIEVPVVIIREDLTENEAFELEMLLILLIGRCDLGTGPLYNLTAGGDGVPMSPEKQLAASRKGGINSIAVRRAKGNLGWSMTLEQRRAAGSKGGVNRHLKSTPEQQQQIVNNLRIGQAKLTPERRSAIAKIASDAALAALDHEWRSKFSSEVSKRVWSATSKEQRRVRTQAALKARLALPHEVRSQASRRGRRSSQFFKPTDIIVVLASNLKRPGSKAYALYELYGPPGSNLLVSEWRQRAGTDVGAALEWDLEHGFIAIERDQERIYSYERRSYKVKGK